MGKLFRQKEFGIAVVLLLLCGVISLINPVFLSFDNVIDVIKGNAVLGILAIGMTLVIITGGIDVSVAAVTSAVAVILGHVMLGLPDGFLSLMLLFLLAPLCGIALGLLNGLLVAKIKIPPIVVTLGTMSIINGSILFFTNGVYLNSTNFPKVFISFADSRLFGVSILIYILFAVALLTWFILKHTVAGRFVYAIGGNRTAAGRVGINLDRIQLFVYGYMGFLAGVAAIAQTAYTKAVDPNGLLGFELTVIAAVVIGGANILGGSGSVAGSLLGALLLGVMQNGLILLHIDTYWQKVVVGLVILAAVSYDHLQRKRAEEKLMKVEVEGEGVQW
ncbi:ABC transporter permease [Brevibacillus massiliensis]|uniref:ABC transporter permease n=1 Tax=Brevibacillus massiliensis TaxID=1118054 RepID=UPI0002DE1DF9|nr:ABC transporter permease [Brevibacillus massiliensis]